MNTISIALGILCLVTMFKPRFIKQSRDNKGRFSKLSDKMPAKKKLAKKQVEYWGDYKPFTNYR